MAEFVLSAFADEYSPVFDEQIKGLKENNVVMIEIRGVDGRNISDITEDQAKELRRKLDDAGIGVSTIGSPIGKIRLSDDFDAHLDVLRRCCASANILGTNRVRMFSFYGAPGKNITECGSEVIDKLGRMLDVADEYGVVLCHENEKGIYGDVPSRCRELHDALPRLGCVFDHANFIQSGAVPYPDGYNLLADKITYLHIKDANADGTIVPAGRGIGRIPETLRELDKREGTIILTVEPHLRVFPGLSALEGGERTKLGNAYETSAEAFAAAVAGLRNCIEEARK